MNYSFKLEGFEGPLDLLLHLIEKNRMNIYDIPIAEITDQYMACVSAMETEDLDFVSEFLLMAATLLDIKARMLLPAEKNEKGEKEDPREDLVARLLEYKMCRLKAEELKSREELASQHFYRSSSVPAEVLAYEEPVCMDEILKDLTMERLHEIFESVLRRQEDRVDPVRSTFGKIKKEPFRVSEKIHSVLSMTRNTPRLSFRDLLEKQAGRTEIIVTFLAVLELIKMGALTAQQTETDGEIELVRAENSVSAEELEKAMELEF